MKLHFEFSDQEAQIPRVQQFLEELATFVTMGDGESSATVEHTTTHITITRSIVQLDDDEPDEPDELDRKEPLVIATREEFAAKLELDREEGRS